MIDCVKSGAILTYKMFWAFALWIDVSAVEGRFKIIDFNLASIVDSAFASDANAWQGECGEAKFAEEDATEEVIFSEVLISRRR